MTLKKIAWAVLCAALCLAGCKQKPAADPEDASKLAYAPEVNEVEVITLQRQTFPMQLVANGKLSATQRSALYFRESGQLVEVPVQNGSAVARGAVLARLDDTEQREYFVSWFDPSDPRLPFVGVLDPNVCTGTCLTAACDLTALRGLLGNLAKPAAVPAAAPQPACTNSATQCTAKPSP